MLTIHNILHPTDFSKASECAFRWACALALDYSAHLTIVHVMNVPLVFNDGVLFPGSSTDQEQLRELLESLPAPDDSVGVIRRLEAGNPAMEILRLAQLCHADLIVMGTHGRQGLERLLMGSVAEKIVRKASCPVLTVATLPQRDSLVRTHREVAPSPDRGNGCGRYHR